MLSALDVPRPARVRGADLGPWLTGRAAAGDPGLAFAETETQTLLARGPLRLVCARKVGACSLYDAERDARQALDVSVTHPGELAEMRSALRALEASHGRYELRGQREAGKAWPEALRRGIAGDADAATDVAALLEDADVAIRRKAGEVLFDLRRPETAPALRLALVRDEDDEVRRYATLALTRLGEGASRARELVKDGDPRWRRLAALALAESGDDRGEDVLVAWWRKAYAKDVAAREREPIPFERAREIADAFAKIHSKQAVPALVDALEDVRLRPYLAASLAAIGEDFARPALAERLSTERYQTARVALTEALVKLGAGPELREPLVKFLGTPDPLPDGLRYAIEADILELVGGPRRRDLDRLRRFARSGVAMPVVVPKGGNGQGARVLCRARSTDDLAGEIRFGLRDPDSRLKPKRDRESIVPARAPELDPDRSLALPVPPADHPRDLFAALPARIVAKPATLVDFVVYATQNVELVACAVVPLGDELPPPPPEPWAPP